MAERAIESRRTKPNQSIQNKTNQIFKHKLVLLNSLCFLEDKRSTGNCWNICRWENNQTKAKPNHPNQTDSLNTLDHLIFVTKACLQNFSFLCSVEVGYLWLDTTTKNKSVLGATLALSSSWAELQAGAKVDQESKNIPLPPPKKT